MSLFFFLYGCSSKLVNSNKQICSTTNQTYETQIIGENSKSEQIEGNSIENTQNSIEKRSYDDLNEAEKQQYEMIKSNIENNEIYCIELSKTDEENKEILFDFDCDGFVEPLLFKTFLDKNEYGNSIIYKCVMTIDGKIVSYENDDGIETMNIVDFNKNDKCIDFYIVSGTLGYFVSNSLYVYNNEIMPDSNIYSPIIGYNGNGEVYYSEGCIDGLSTDMVIIYYDYNDKKFIKTDQIVGKKVTFYRDVFLYKTYEDVNYAESHPDGTEEFIRKIIKSGEDVTIISIDEAIGNSGNSPFYNDRVKVRTDDELEGWIGGFLIVWS